MEPLVMPEPSVMVRAYTEPDLLPSTPHRAPISERASIGVGCRLPGREHSSHWARRAPSPPMSPLASGSIQLLAPRKHVDRTVIALPCGTTTTSPGTAGSPLGVIAIPLAPDGFVGRRRHRPLDAAGDRAAAEVGTLGDCGGYQSVVSEPVPRTSHFEPSGYPRLPTTRQGSRSGRS
jgi:hypothetical protein